MCSKKFEEWDGIPKGAWPKPPTLGLVVSGSSLVTSSPTSCGGVDEEQTSGKITHIHWEVSDHLVENTRFELKKLVGTKNWTQPWWMNNDLRWLCSNKVEKLNSWMKSLFCWSLKTPKLLSLNLSPTTNQSPTHLTTKHTCATISAPAKHSWVLTSPEGVVMLTCQRCHRMSSTNEGKNGLQPTPNSKENIRSSWDFFHQTKQKPVFWLNDSKRFENHGLNWNKINHLRAGWIPLLVVNKWSHTVIPILSKGEVSFLVRSEKTVKQFEFYGPFQQFAFWLDFRILVENHRGLESNWEFNLSVWRNQTC